MQPTVISGVVTRFKGNGRKLGYPTANINSNTGLHDGVYFGFANMGEFTNHPALIFIGTPTTLGDTDRRVEAYLLDIPDKDYYEEDLRLDVMLRHRANQTFPDLESLIEAMHDDEKQARDWFATN